MTVEPIVIWGAGAIGGTVGAFLARAGHDVLLVDIVEEHVRKVAKDGLTIEGPIATFTTPLPAVTPDALAGRRFHTILLAVKSYHTEQATRDLLPHLAEDGAVASFQNGLNELVIAEIVGRPRTIGVFVNFASDYLGPGRITYGGRSPMRVGELDGRDSPRVRALAAALRDFEPDTEVTDNVVGYLWGKSAYSALLAYTALTNERMEDIIADPAHRPALHGLIREVLLVGAADGARPLGFHGFDPTVFLANDVAAMDASLDANAASKSGSAKKHSGYWRDLAIRKRPTDIAAQMAPVLAIARRHGLTMPLVDRVLVGIAHIEQGRRTPSLALAEEVLSLASEGITAAEPGR
jgi:2-dehydropantoate 2-reductase